MKRVNPLIADISLWRSRTTLNQKSTNGNKKWGKILNFKDGKLITYAKSAEGATNGNAKCKKILIFENDKLVEYYKNNEMSVDENKGYSENITYEKRQTS